MTTTVVTLAGKQINVPDFCTEHWHHMMVDLLHSLSFHREDELPSLTHATQTIHSPCTVYCAQLSSVTLYSIIDPCAAAERRRTKFC